MEIKTIPNQILNGELKPLNLNKVDTIVLHHMATNANIKDIEAAHIRQTWNAIGYNFWVGFDGSVYRGRGFNMGAGVFGHNDHIISIGFQGDYSSPLLQMPETQFNAGIDAISYVKSNVPTAKVVVGHRDLMATECPGRNFPLKEMQNGVKRGIDRYKNPSIVDVTNELLWRSIITDQPLWNQKATDNENIKWLFTKYYPYIMVNGGSVKTRNITSDQALEILQRQKIITDYTYWNNLAYEDNQVYWLLIKMADYIN